MKKIKVGIIGATGYAGVELLRLLLNHPMVEVAAISSVSNENENISNIYKNLIKNSDFKLTNEDDVILKSDIVFSSLPHSLAEKVAAKCKDKILIDLSADFRLESEENYKKWYGLSYTEKSLHKNAQYIIPEIHSDKITKDLKIIANPGCYPTSVILALYPILKKFKIKENSIIIDSKSGVTGAGKSLSDSTHFPSVNEAFSAYKVAVHRHTPEIEENISKIYKKEIKITFVPHLLPVNRGILSTCYVEIDGKMDAKKIRDAFDDEYKNKTFIRVLKEGSVADIKNVKLSNYCDISLHFDERTNKVIVISAIDNMVKGAAGQAIQNMNLLLGFAEDEGLKYVPAAF